MTQNLGLDGKAAIVAGGGARGEGIGNGRAAAVLLARAGARVFVVDRDEALAARTVEMIEAEGGEAASHGSDLTQEDQCEAMVAAAVDRFGRLDVLDNNIGIGSSATVVEESAANWQRVMRINVEAMFLISKFAIPAMIESGGGSIVNISSISALRPRGLTAYSTSKGAVMALTSAMAVDHATDGIRVNCIAPGIVESDMGLNLVLNWAGVDDPEELYDKVPFNRLVKPPDVGELCVYLASNDASHISGQVIYLDSGIGPKSMRDIVGKGG